MHARRRDQRREAFERAAAAADERLALDRLPPELDCVDREMRRLQPPAIVTLFDADRKEAVGQRVWGNAEAGFHSTLEAGALTGHGGIVHFHPAFDEAE